VSSAGVGGDPYVYPGSAVLQNRAGIRDPAVLEQFERRVTSIRMDQLAASAPTVKATVEHIQEIHRQIFQDIYDWAGALRTVNMARGETLFAPVKTPAHDLKSWGQAVLSQLTREGQLQGLERPRFVERLAHHTEELNFWHPFREDNGRTLRIFLEQVARGAGYSIDYTKVTPEAWNAAAARAQSDSRAFVTVLNGMVTVPRAIAFDREPRERALQRFPELQGAYRVLSATERALSVEQSPERRVDRWEAQKATLSQVLHQGVLVRTPRESVRARSIQLTPGR
jgi:cell filamentation protein